MTFNTSEWLFALLCRQELRSEANISMHEDEETSVENVWVPSLQLEGFTKEEHLLGLAMPSIEEQENCFDEDHVEETALRTIWFGISASLTQK